MQKTLIRSFLFVRIQFILWTVEHYHFHSLYMIRDVAIRVQIPEDFLWHSLFYDIIKGPWQWKNDTAMFTPGAWSESKDLEIFCDTEIMINHIILQVHDPWCGGESPRTWGLPGGDDISIAHSGPEVSRWVFLGFSIWLGQHTSYLSRTPRIYLCKFFLASVNFYRFNAKNWQFTVYFAVITQKIGNSLFILS